MLAGLAGELGRHRGVQPLGLWNRPLAHPAYDSCWSEPAVDKVQAT